MDGSMTVWLFWSTLSLVAYTYLGYPFLLSLVRDCTIDSASPMLPTVTVVVAAHNEASCIAQKVQNILDHDYPPERLDVIVVSDGSSDDTAARVRRLEGTRVRLLVQPRQKGKNAALNRGVAVASGEIVVFTDANAMLAPCALRHLVAPFCDPHVGLVSGQGSYGDRGNGTTRVVSNAYVRYEAFIKQRESNLGFLAAADGALYAMRRMHYQHLPITYVHDLLHPIQVARAGGKSKFVPAAYTIEPPSQGAGSEYQRHVRIIAQGLLVFLTQTPALLLCGRFAACWMLVSHRFLRWISAPLLVAVLAANVCLVTTSHLYQLSLILQLSFYACALGGAIVERWNLRFRLLAVPYYFCVVSLAGIGGLLHFLRGHRQVAWRPTGATQ